MKFFIVWFRADLRIADHQPLWHAYRAAIAEGGILVPIYVVDPVDFGPTKVGFERCGQFQQQFLRQSLHDLASQFKQLGSELLILGGSPADVIADLAKTTQAQRLYFYDYAAPEEQATQQAVDDAVTKLGVECHRSVQETLYAADSLPFEIADLPELFTNFRRKVEKQGEIPSPLPAPLQLKPIPSRIRQQISTIDMSAALAFSTPAREPDRRAVLEFKGGQTAGLVRLEQYIWKNDCLRDYKQTRNGMLGADYSSKFSPWLAAGCLSARMIHAEVVRYERERIKNDSTYWMTFELLWRDYFRFIMAKHGRSLFRRSGLRNDRLPWRIDWPMFEVWKTGRTGYPLIDANMRELAATGFMSNRGRQNVASFLTKNLGIDWRMGAEWFESQLIDYDPCSNYGNWNYAAGVGNDARGFRWFNTIKQSEHYDPDGSYVRHWLPELQAVPTQQIHTPWQMTPAEQADSSCVIGKDYPAPVVELAESAERHERLYQQAVEKRSMAGC